jgi:hypothetical protein
MNAWSRKQYAEAETKLDEARAILEEIWHEESKTFTNRLVHWQRSEAGEAEQARLHAMDNLIHELHDARETLIGMQAAALEPAHPAEKPKPSLPSKRRRGPALLPVPKL